MTGRFLNGVVLVLVLGLGLTQSSHVINDPYQFENEMKRIDDMKNEMKLDEVNVRSLDNKQLQANVNQQQIDGILKIYEASVTECKREAKMKIEKLIEKARNRLRGISKRHYQDLIHLKKSFASNEDLTETLRSEMCSACAFEKVCENPLALTLLGVSTDLGNAAQRRQCKATILTLAATLFPESPKMSEKCDEDAPFRTINGKCNNLKNPYFGAVGGELQRLVVPDYGDCVSTLRRARNGDELPNARNVSRFVHDGNDETERPESNRLTHLAMNFAQFLDHDVTLVEAQGLECEPDNESPECINIEVPADDVSFTEREVNFFELERDAPHRPSEECKLIPRGHSNTITAFIDTSNVYGSSEEEVANLRGSNGLLRTMKHPQKGCPMQRLLPAQDPDLFCFSRDPLRPCFAAGDERANENQGLISVHTIFVREHNRIATIFNRITDWNAEEIFQETRRILGAVFQVIVYKEFLPLVLSKETIRENELELLSGKTCFKDYDPTLNAQMFQAFSTAAYRFGHSLIRDTFSRLSQNGFEHNYNDYKSEFLPIPVLDFGNPTYIYDKGQGGLDAIYRGLVDDSASKLDGLLSSSVQLELSRGEGDLADLLAINIERAREHGVPGYVEYHNNVCRIRPRIRDFDDLKAAGFSDVVIANFKSTYDDVRDIDLFSGGMHEPTDENGGLLGPTFQCIIAEQFKRLKFGDRFWHENCNNPALNTDNTAFTPCQLQEIRKANLAKIICSNADDIPTIPKTPMEQSQLFVSCCELPGIDLEKYVKCGAEEKKEPAVVADSTEW